MVEHVRSQIDEDETSDISNATILQTLNRAQMRLQRIAVKRWPSLFQTETEVVVTGRTQTIPAEAYGFVVNSVDVKVGTSYHPLTPVKLAQIIHEDTAASTTVPQYWSTQGNTLHIFPKASASTLRIRYQRRLPQLVLKWGQIESVTEGDASTDTLVYLDSVSSSFTTSTTSLAAFTNVVDPGTGEVLGTYQTTAVGSTYVGFGTRTRTTAYEYDVIQGRQTQAAIEALDYEYPAQDDYVCSAAGSCVPPLGQDVADYLVQYAVVELKRKAGEDIKQEQDRLTELEQDMETMWAGRPSQLRVQRRNPHWGGARTSLQTKYRD
jgi:hypothetical protein